MSAPVASVTEQVASPGQVCGHEIEPHNTRDTKSLGTPLVNAIISSNRFQEIQLPLTQQINSQEPVKFQLTHPVQQSKQEPVQFTRPVRILDQDISRRLQLLIQHCYGKAREAIESCVNLPVEEGYYVAKNTLRENFGRPHIIAKKHIKKLENLPPLKQADGTSLLEFARHLDVAQRTLTGMGPTYVSDLNLTNTLRELNRKLSLFMRVK